MESPQPWTRMSVSVWAGELASTAMHYSREGGEVAMPTDPGKLVPEGMRQLGGKENPLFWDGTDRRVLIGAIATGNDILPFHLFANDPYAPEDSSSKMIKIGGEEQRFYHLESKHYMREGDHAWIGQTRGTVTNRSRAEGSMTHVAFRTVSQTIPTIRFDGSDRDGIRSAFRKTPDGGPSVRVRPRDGQWSSFDMSDPNSRHDLEDQLGRMFKDRGNS